MKTARRAATGTEGWTTLPPGGPTVSARGAPRSGVSGFGETRPSRARQPEPAVRRARLVPAGGGQNREPVWGPARSQSASRTRRWAAPGRVPDFRPPRLHPFPRARRVLVSSPAGTEPRPHPGLQVRGTGDLSTLKELTEPSSVAMETSCKDLGLLLRTSVRGRDQDLKTDSADGSRTEGKAPAMAAKRGKPGVPQGRPRGAAGVPRGQPGGAPARPVEPAQAEVAHQPGGAHRRREEDAAVPARVARRHGQARHRLAAGGQGQGGRGRGPAPLSRNLSKSEHSLFQGKPRPFSPLAAPRAGQAEPHPARALRRGQAPQQGARRRQGQGGEGDKPFLKVDPELVVTVLGDLEQLLFSQMLDPESQRKRTVQNVLDLRQNLEDTMSSLRGAQLSHSCMETGVCYDSDETNARSVSSTSNRSSPLSWRYGQSSPRLQAGDAPSSTGGGYHGGQGPAQYASRTMPARNPSRLGHASRGQLIEGPDADDPDLKSGYLSDSDLVSKSLNEDDDLGNGWDESSSISSGLSDGSDNLSSEDFNASSSLNSLPTTPVGSRRNSSVVVSDGRVYYGCSCSRQQR
ncbi:hypothetical protein ANANG_G00243330 [Anguilla anguilla]|uniref:Uncharacterized protein n=1 Tax=Anguilla anguilla TaxID=7936 RepID=A0A9D3LR24_ANGAN|nr:hypothetical protein ANANG_G00243330 [Anguilla anguilla]